MDPLAAWHDPGLETKYRDVADGNDNRSVGLRGELVVLETKYHDIADGNCSTSMDWTEGSLPLETKYRDIADST